MFKVGDMVMINEELAKDENYRSVYFIRDQLKRFGKGPFKIKKVVFGEIPYTIILKKEPFASNHFLEKELVPAKPISKLVSRLKRASQQNEIK